MHLEAVARQPDWQYRVMRCQAKAIVKAMWKAERETLASGSGGGGHAGSRRSGDAVKRRYIRRKERNNNSNKDAGSGAGAAGGGGGGSGVGGGDSGNGTGTATTSSSTTPTTTPLVANSKLL